MNGMSGSSWRFMRFDRICITVNSNDLKSISKWKYFDVKEFIEKFARVLMMKWKMMQVVMRQTNLIQNSFMTIKNQQIIAWWMSPEIWEKPLLTNQWTGDWFSVRRSWKFCDFVDEVTYEFDEFSGFEKRAQNFNHELKFLKVHQKIIISYFMQPITIW